MDVRSPSPDIVPNVDKMLQCLAEIGAVLWFPEEGLRSLVIRDAVKGFVGPITKVICQHTGTDQDHTQHFLPIHEKMKKNYRAECVAMVTTGVITRRLLEGLMSEDMEVPAEHTPVVIQLMIKFGLLVPLQMAEGDVEGLEHRKYLVPALLPDSEPVPDTLAPLSSSGDGGEGEGGHRFLFHFTTVPADHSALRKSDLKNDGFLPEGLVVRLIGKVLMRSQDTTRSKNWTCHQRWLRVFFSTQQFVLTHLGEYNAIQVDMVGRGTPLAIHARLLEMITTLIKETCRSLHVVTLVGHGDTPTQGLLRASSPSGLRPLFIPLPAVLNAIKQNTPVFGPREFKLGVAEVAVMFAVWLVQLATTKGPYDMFFSYRWNDLDSLFTAMFVDHCQIYVIGEQDPRPLRIFLDNRSLEMGLDFQRSFVGALVQSTVVTMVVSHAALLRMITHNSSEVDNLLLEWLCAKYCFERGIIQRILPVFFGRQLPLDATHLGGSFFEAYHDGLTPQTGEATTILQRLSDHVVAHATVAKAVELLTAVGCWQLPTPTSTPSHPHGDSSGSGSVAVGSLPPPSVFGLSSFSVRAIVQSIAACNGIFARDHHNMYDLLCACGNTIKAIVTDTQQTASSSILVHAAPASPLPLSSSSLSLSVGGLAMSVGVSVGGSDAAISGGASAGGGGGGSAVIGVAVSGVGGGGSPVAAVLDVSGAFADHQVKCEGAMCAWLLTHSPGIHPDTSLIYAKSFYTAKMTTIDRVAKKVGKQPGVLLSLGVEEDDAEDIVQAMRDAQMLSAVP